MKKGKVVSVAPQGDYQLRDGRTLYKFLVSFDNGDSGEYSSVKPEQNKFIVGQDADYEFSSTQYGNKVKPVYNQGGGYSGGGSNYSNNDSKQDLIIRQTALKAAVDFLKDKEAKSSDVLKVAESFVDWVNQKGKEETTYNEHFSSREEKIETARAIAGGQYDESPF